MIAKKSGTWLRQFSVAGVLCALAACSSESLPQPTPLDTDEPGGQQGELAVYVANFGDGTAETRYFLRDADGVEQRLSVNGEIDAAPGRQIKIWGQQRDGLLAVEKYKVVAETETPGDIGAQQQALIDAAPKAGRVMCAAQVNLNGGTGKMTVASVRAGFHATTGQSANMYYRENSFGQVGLDGDSYGPLAYANYSSCDSSYSALATSLKPMLNTMSPVKCDQYAFVMGPDSSCGWLGLGQVGTSDKPQTDTWYIDSVSCTVAVQEPGHNYGMQHSSSFTACGGTVGFADDLSSCTHSEYGDNFDTMGGGCYHMNAWQKLYQKWFAGCNGVRTTSTGTFNLYPIEAPCNGVQVIQVPFPAGKTRTFQSTALTSYYLELRSAIGYDSKLTAPQVFVHAGGAPTLPNSTNPKGLHTWIINTSGNAKAPGLVTGKTFSDPAGGLTITATSVTATSAVIDINYTGGSGTPVCLDGNNTAFTAPGPDDCTTPAKPGDASTPPTTTDARSDTGVGGAAGSTPEGGGAGTAGAAGSAGAGGASGSGGAGGATGGAGGSTGGVSGSGGAGGATTGGTGGSTGGASGEAGKAGSTSRPASPENLGGCGCKLESKRGPTNGLAGLLALGLSGLFTARRRRRGAR